MDGDVEVNIKGGFMTSEGEDLLGNLNTHGWPSDLSVSWTFWRKQSIGIEWDLSAMATVCG